MSEIDIFQNAKPQDGEFFKFKSIGDSVQGTYIDVRNGIDSFGNQQTIYVLQDSAGKIWNLGFRITAVVVHERMNGVRFGQIVGFKFAEEIESKRNPGTKWKKVDIYADPKFVDQEWLDNQKKVEATYTRPSATVSSAKVEEEINEDDIPFGVPANAVPAGGNLPTTEVKPRNEAVDAIRNLAKTKGLTTDAMSEAEADSVIEVYTQLSLTEQNLTKIIIALTGYVSNK